jgi:uncharacterized membrane protein
MDLENKNVRIAMIGMTAALYVVLGYLFQPISFMGLQFRVAELIVGMCIIFPIAGLIGNVLGVFIVNLMSPLGVLDLLLMPVMNIPALACIVLLRERKYLKYVGGVIYAVIISLSVALILNIVVGLPFLLMFIQVLISEVILATLGIVLFSYIEGQIDL